MKKTATRCLKLRGTEPLLRELADRSRYAVATIDQEGDGPHTHGVGRRAAGSLGAEAVVLWQNGGRHGRR